MQILSKTAREKTRSALLVLLFVFSDPCPVAAQPTPEYQVKAVFIFNFTQFVEWPSTSFSDEKAPFVIGILGKDPFGKYLEETIRNERVKEHPIVVRRYQRVDEIEDCHILFINFSNRDELKTIFDAIKAKNILTIGDAPNFAYYGGMIRFYTEDKKTRIRINLDAVNNSQLSISSKLLQLADLVRSKNN